MKDITYRVSEKLGSKSGSICDSYFGCGGSAPLPAERTLGSRLSLNNSFRVKSLPGSVLRMNWSRMSSMEREEDEKAMRIPGLRLHSSASSSDDNISSYDNVPCSRDVQVEMASMALLGVPGAAPRGTRIVKPHMQLGGIDWDSDHATAEWVQTIDINVIQPTPNISPCGSVRSISDDMPRLTLPGYKGGRGRAISVLSLDSPEFDSHSIGSDSVFMDDSIFETSVTESFESGMTPRSTSPRSASPRQAARQIHSFRLAINPNGTSPAHGQSPHKRKLTRHTLQPQDSLNLPSSSKVPKTGSSLAPPAMGVNLSTSCERLAAHGSLVVQESVSSSRNTLYLMPSLSIEDEPQCSSYKVPQLRRCNSATTPELKEEAAAASSAPGKASYQRSDSAQNPLRRAGSDCGRRKNSNGSSSESDDAESVSFHLMVPQLSVDVTSAETSRIESSPSPSPPPLPPDEPGPSLLEIPRIRGSRSPSPSRGLRTGPRGRVLQRQFSQCGPSPSPVRDLPLPHCSLPTYVEEDEESPQNTKFPPLDLPFPKPPAEFQDPNNPSPPSQFKDPKDPSPPSQFKDSPEDTEDQTTPTNSVLETTC